MAESSPLYTQPSHEPLASGLPPPAMKKRQTSAPSAVNGSYIGPSGEPVSLEAALEQWRRDSLEGMVGGLTGSPGAEGNGVVEEGSGGGGCHEFWQQVFNSVVYGAINACACLPVLYGYAQIVFGNEVYQTYMPWLAKLFILSSVVHQVVFCLVSSLPYAVGQVQDAGLIFLSHIASSIAVRMQAQGCSPLVVTVTALVVINLFTAMLGVALMVLGRAKLARLVSYLPMPVIGGQIVFIAAFCFRAGVALSIGHDLASLSDWAGLWDEHLIILVLPGVLAGAAMSWVSRKVPHPLALPAVMVATPLVFYAVLLASGTSMEEARRFGWLGAGTVPASARDSLSLYRLEVVQWKVLWAELPTWLGMVFVVAFSSCLDIVAIEIDGGRALNKNHELSTVGLSNFLAGLLGGFTGSYIFSQTIFTYRTKTTSRLCGWVLVAAEAGVFLANVDLLSLIPLYFFAATLHFITIELLFEWLWEVRRRMTSKEYLVLWTTALGNTFLGIIQGFTLGIVCSMLMFTISFAKASARAAQPAFQRSRVVRHRSVRRLLDQRGRILTLELGGAIFFGSSSDTLVHIQSLLGVPSSSPSQQKQAKAKRAATAKHQPQQQQASSGGGWGQRLLNRLMGRRPPSTTSSVLKRPSSSAELAASRAEKAALLGASHSGSSSSLPIDIPPSYDSTGNLQQPPRLKSPPPAPLTAAVSEGASSSSGPRPRFLVLDFRRVTAIDMSSVTNCFLPLQSLCRDLRVVLVYCNCNQRVEFYLRSNRLIDDHNTHLISTLHAALDFCETQCIVEELALRHQQHVQQRGAAGATPQQQRLALLSSSSSSSQQPPASPYLYYGSSLDHGASSSLHVPLRARAFSLRGAPQLTVSQVLRTLLALDLPPPPPLHLQQSSSATNGVAAGSLTPHSPALQEMRQQLASMEEGGQQQQQAASSQGAGSAGVAPELDEVGEYVGEEAFKAGATVFFPQEPADCFFLVLCGEVALESPVEQDEAAGHSLGDQQHRVLHLRGMGGVEEVGRRTEVVLRTGSLFGFVDFYLECPRRFFATALTDDTRLAVFREDQLRRLEADKPRLLLVLQRILLRQFAVELGNVSAI